MIKPFIMCVIVLLSSASIQAEPKKITSDYIIQATLKAAPNCLHYQIPTHYCLWMTETGKVTTTPVLSHYLPDVVVSVFNKPTDNPWLEISKTLDNAAKPLQQGIVKTLTGISADSGNHSLQTTNEQSVIFKEVDIIGNPALPFMGRYTVLPSAASSLQPYYQSLSDSALWRGISPTSLLEEGAVLSMRHVGSGLINWGSIYPHEGKIIADNDVQASAVLAQRAGDLISSDNPWGHIYKKLSNNCGEHCSAEPIHENSKETYFQMIYPVMQSSCQVLSEVGSYQTSMLNPDGAYLWIIWRHYDGCENGKGQYIGKV